MTSVRINFPENVMATFDLIAKGGYMSFRKNKTKQKNKRFSPFAEQLMIASTYG